MDFAEDWTTRRGLSLMTLNVFAGNERARRFYDRGGFEVEMMKYAKRHPTGRTHTRMEAGNGLCQKNSPRLALPVRTAANQLL